MASPQRLRIRSAVWPFWCRLHLECSGANFRDPMCPRNAGNYIAISKKYMGTARTRNTEGLFGSEERCCGGSQECSTRGVCLEIKAAAPLNGDIEYNSATPIRGSTKSGIPAAHGTNLTSIDHVFRRNHLHSRCCLYLRCIWRVRW